MRTRTKPDTGKVYVAWQSFSGLLPDGSSPVFPAGTRLRGDHPAVRQHFGNFVLDGAPADEVARVREEAADAATRRNREEPSPESSAARIVEAVPIMWRALDDIDFDNGRLRRKLKKGEQVADDDPLRLAAPASFGRVSDDAHHWYRR